jgi:tetratricopeptide (TPR) repeat protein
MMSLRRRGSKALIAAAVVMGIVAGTPGDVRADAITKVKGLVTDEKGKPLAKVPIYFEAVDITKTVGPVKTNKKGKFIISTLDRSVAKKWRVVPRMKGYKTVKMQFVIIDSSGAELLNGERFIDSKQEHPDFQLALVGNDGRNEFNFMIARDKNYEAALRAERRKAQGGDAVAEAEVKEEGPSAAALDLAKQLEKAKQLTGAGRHDQAIEIYTAFLAKDPKGNPPVYYYLGKSLFGSGDLARAEQAFRQALELQPKMRGCHFYLGNIAVKNEDYSLAVTEFEGELALSPESDSVLLNLGQARAKGGDADGALAAFQKAVQVNPEKSEAYLQMAGIYEQRGEKDKAEEMYQQVISLDPKNAALSFYNLGVHAWNENRGNEATQAFRKALELDPTYAASHRELARALMGLQDFPGALQHFEEYLKLNPMAPDASEIKDSIALLKQ